MIQKTITALTAATVLYATMPNLANANDSYKLEKAANDYTLPVTIELAQANSRDLSQGLEGRVGINVTEMVRQSKEGGFWNTIKNIGVVLSSPVRPSQWSEHPYRTGGVTAGYVIGIAAAASGGSGGGSPTAVVEEVEVVEEKKSSSSSSSYVAPVVEEPEPSGGHQGGGEL